MLKPGDRVPDFELPVATAESRRGRLRFAEVLGDGDVLIVFYPLAFTGTCTEQVCEARDSLHFLEHVGARAFGFSCDSAAANQAYAQKENLGYPLISDPNREVVHRIWDTQRVAGVDDVPKRGLMIVGPDGIVKWVWQTDDADEWPGLDEAKRVLHAGHHH